MRRPLRGLASFHDMVMGGFVLCGALAPCPARASQPADPIVYQSPSLRIYRALSAQGRPILVLTNLDEEGNALSPVDAGADAIVAPAPSDLSGPCGPARDAGTPPPRDSGGAGARVVLNRDGSSVPASEGEVQVQPGAAGVTTVIVNIEMPPAPATPPLPVYVPFVVNGPIGGLRYPDRLPFLGYGTSNDTPVWFGGLGLSSTARYARALGRPDKPEETPQAQPRASGR